DVDHPGHPAVLAELADVLLGQEQGQRLRVGPPPLTGRPPPGETPGQGAEPGPFPCTVASSEENPPARVSSDRQAASPAAPQSTTSTLVRTSLADRLLLTVMTAQPPGPPGPSTRNPWGGPLPRSASRKCRHQSASRSTWPLRPAATRANRSWSGAGSPAGTDRARQPSGPPTGTGPAERKKTRL